ncbi:MAG TPA: protein kinase [Dactylosporangium sp.]|nr:protein kinase [Dactylosporangium sp.]
MLGCPFIGQWAGSDLLKTLVDRYRLDYAIGAGGLGIVWRARDLRRQCMVAIKEVRLPDALADAERAALGDRAAREAGAAAQLRHPGVVAVHEVVLHEGHPWIVMDLVEGRSLDERVRSDGPLSPAGTAELGLALLEALRAAHAAGIVHGDVKPANVLIDADGNARLTDFALAATLGDGVPLGEPAYIAPERRRSGEGGPSADLFSLGATLAFAATGHDPVDAEGDGPLDGAIRALMSGDPQARPSTRDARNALLVAAGREPEEHADDDNLELSDSPKPADTPKQADSPKPADSPEPGDSRKPDEGPEPQEATNPDESPAESQRPVQEQPAAEPEPQELVIPDDSSAEPGRTPIAAPPKKRWSEVKTAALVGVGILAFLIGIGTLSRGSNAASEAAQGAPAASASRSADQPSPTPAAADVAPPVTSPSASTKPTKTRTTPAPKAAVLSAKIAADPDAYNGACTSTGLEIEVTVTITTNQPGTKVTFTATGRGTRTVTTTGSTYITTYRVHIDNTRKNVFTLQLNVTSPSTVSDATTVTDDCTKS